MSFEPKPRSMAAVTITVLFGEEAHPTLEKVLADSSYEGSFVESAQGKVRVVAEIVRKLQDQTGFAVQSRRWVVEPTLAWFGKCGRLARDDEELAQTTEAWKYLATSRLYLRRSAADAN